MKRKKRTVIWLRVPSKWKIFLTLVMIALLIGVFTYQLPVAKTWTAWSTPLSGRVIAIDAGHGGPDGGAVSKEGIIEKDINLSIALYLRDYLQQAGAAVVMTREVDKDLADEDPEGSRKTQDLKRRVKLIQDQHADMMISIHLNSIPSSRWSGAQTFFYPDPEDQNKRLATFIQNEIKSNLQNTNRVAKTQDSVVYLLKSLKIPSALVEVGFLSNPREANLLASEAYQKKVAASIYRGILRYSSGENLKAAE